MNKEINSHQKHREWFGEIPFNWQSAKLKRLIKSASSGGTPDSSNDSFYSDAGIPWVTISDITNSSQIKNTAKHITDEAINDKNLKIYPKGTILLAMYASVGKVAELCTEASVNQAILAISVDTSKMSNDYLKFCFNAYEPYIKSESNGTTQFNLNANTVLNLSFPLPTLKEQNEISKRISEKSFVIDQLISNQEKQIEKLKEYRQAIITKAVTKGLDPNVPMKDSGIEWIGEIPNNVNVSSVKNFYDITLGKMLQPKQENENDTLEYYFCAANLGNDCLKTNDLKQMWFSVKEKEKYSLKRGDLLVVEGGDVASSSIISTDVSNIYFQNSIHRVRPIHGLNEYLHYYLIFVKGSGYFDVNCNKATIMHFTKDKFSNLPFLIRNTEEQKKIVTFLNKEEAKINRLISIKEKKIEFLTNYKKSLIYEYVTGKKRVSL